MQTPEPFRSFWMGGFEGADHVNGFGVALDMAQASGHVDRLDEDYANAARHGLRSVRESIGWRLTEPEPGRYDFARVERIAAAARRHGIQVVWTLMHYGTPADVDLFDDSAIARFAAFAAACARTIGPLSDHAPVYNPINEIGFLAWAVSETEMIYPYRRDRPGNAESSEASGYVAKRRLVRAVLAGIDAIRRIDTRARFLHVEPLLHVVAPSGRADLQPLADRVRGYQWQAWDLLGGLAEPELGGSAEALDLLGVNYYHSGQWEAATEERLHWAHRDRRRMPFSQLLAEAWDRYRRPMVIAETSHVGVGRAPWLAEVASETRRAIDRGIPVGGICLYPLVDRNDWNQPDHWHRSGLWDAGSDRDPAPPQAPRRLLHLEYAEALAHWQRCLPPQPNEVVPRTTLLILTAQPWSYVWQRLQQLTERLAHHYRVVVVEEPAARDGPPYFDRWAQTPGVEVWVPQLALPAGGFADPRLAPWLAGELRERGHESVVGWLATPLALPAIAALQPLAVIYDCHLAPITDPESPAAHCEAELVQRADLVVAASPALCALMRPLNRHVEQLRLAVDVAPFDPLQLSADTEEGHSAANAQRHIGQPRFGYFGAIDERFDLALLAELADRRPQWNFVIVGPVRSIDPALLPQRPNIHWLGLQPYRRLGYFALGWQAVLLPFAINESTQATCPTKPLEALATGLPVISAPLGEVQRLYGRHLRIAGDIEGWLRACEEALAEMDEARAGRVAMLRPLLAEASCDDSAAAVHLLIEDAITRRAAGLPR